MTDTGMPTPRDVNPTGQRAAAVQSAAIESATRVPTYDRWLLFHKEFPGVYLALEGLALYSIRQRPNRRFGVKALWEIARWEDRKAFGDLGKTLGENWQLPNDYTSMYARLLGELHPEFLGSKEPGQEREPYFEMRKLRSAKWPKSDADKAARLAPITEARQAKA